MKPWEGMAAALGGAALAITALYMIPGAIPGGSDEQEEAAPAEEHAFGVVEADAETLTHAGITLAKLSAGTAGNVQSGYARALDLSSLAAINADYRAAVAAAAASARELTRQKALFTADTSTSARAVEQAQAQQAADAEKVKLACRRVSLEYGAGLERLGCPALDVLLRDASAGRAVLVRLDFANGPPSPGSYVTISGNGETGVRVLGPAAFTDPQLQTTGALAVVHGPSAARFAVGQVFDASISAGNAVQTGVIVPRAAIMRTDGALWAYRADKADSFTRVMLKDAKATPDGWLVREGFKPGDTIVVSGAGTLFGLERGAPAGEE